jgi:hypothetical protein
MDELAKMLREMDEALIHAEEMKHKITGILIDERHLDLLTVNWRRLRQWIRRK